MKIILLKDVAKLGRKYDTKEVSDGYAQNLLIPRGDAIPATSKSAERLNLEKAKMEGERRVQSELLAENIKSLNDITLTVSGKANEKGHLFAGIHREEIVKELSSQLRLSLEESSIMLEHPIKEVGEHMIEVKVAGKTAKFKLIIKAL